AAADDTAAGDGEAPKEPARPRRKVAAAGEPAPNGSPNPLEAASEAVRAAVREASGQPAGDEAA
ncbi:MAG TPA: hypothetical protein VI006_21230, partial [Solirubrobacteraceae bacterium]